MAAADMVLRIWEYVCASEAAYTCLRFHQAAWGHCVGAVFLDTCSAEAQAYLSAQPQLDFYYQGFRCNPFSLASNGMDPQQRREQAVHSLEELQASLRFAGGNPPRAVIIENVASLLSMEFLHEWQLLRALLSRVGPYTWRYQVISPAQDLQADADRVRLWIVGLSDLPAGN
jgi:site-specific DNA-cytosine methylase